jgi:hypothetical protein
VVRWITVKARRWVVIQDGTEWLTFSTDDGVTLYPETPNMTSTRVTRSKDDHKAYVYKPNSRQWR